MSDSHTASSVGRFEVRTTSDSHFSWLRTRLSVERTMMSWQRTAVALIGFGFAIVQYFNHLQQIPGARPAYLPTAPEYLGLALISCGILALVIRFGSTSGRFVICGADRLRQSPECEPVWQRRRRTRRSWRSPSSSSLSACLRSLPCCSASLSPKAKQPRPISTLGTPQPTNGDRDG
jgi:hypothetical protein